MRTAQRPKHAPGSEGNGVQVIVRIRPMLPRELHFDNAVEVLSSSEVVVYKPDAEFASTYDHVFGQESTQEQVYTQVQGSVLSSLQGFNATVFAYGQTGTGKTFTMLTPPGVDLAALASGPPTAATQQQQQQLGVVPRALADLFREARARQLADGSRVQLVASYMEIYNDRLYDLLQPYKKGLGSRDPSDMQQRKALLEVREDKSGGTFVPNLLCVKVSSYASVLALLAKGNRNRAVRHTDMNVSSSRSHAILQLVLEQWPAAEGCAGAASGGGGVMGPRPPAGTLLRSKLNFVDLAGSERWDKGATMGADRVTEMNAINGSLSALAGVVAALTGGVAKRHVPYRDSKLTHLLQDSLGGNCRTTIIATISPSADAFDESVSTLKFADRASAIGNNPVVNTSRDLSSVLALKEREINRLRQLLAAYMSAQPQLAPGPELPLKVLTAGPAWQEGLSSASTSPTRSRPSVSGWQATALGDEPESGASSGGAAAEQLLNELMELRRALDMERALRSELEAKLSRQGGDAASTSLLTSNEHAGGGRLVTASPDATQSHEEGRSQSATGATPGTHPGAASSVPGEPRVIHSAETGRGAGTGSLTRLLSSPRQRSSAPEGPGSASGSGSGQTPLHLRSVSGSRPSLTASTTAGTPLGSSPGMVDPFAAVMSRRAALGLAAGPTTTSPGRWPPSSSPPSNPRSHPSTASVTSAHLSISSAPALAPYPSRGYLDHPSPARHSAASFTAGAAQHQPSILQSLSAGLSPSRRPPQAPLAAWGPQPARSRGTSPMRRSGGPGGGGALEAALANIRMQVQQLQQLEQQNKQRAMQLAQASRGHRASSSPARRRPVGSATRPSPPPAWPSKAGPNPYAPPVAKPASSGGRLPYPGVTGGPMQAGLSPGKLVGTGAPPSASWQGQSGQASSGRSGSGPGAGDEFEQLLRAAHASVQPAALQPVPHTQWQQQQLGQGQEQQQVRQGREQQVEQSGAAGQPGSSVPGQVSPTPCPTLPRPTPPVAWGRSALLMGATPLLAPLPSGSTPATATQAQLPAAVSSPPRDSHHLAALPPDSPGAATAQPRPVAAAWGRSALLNSAASAGDGSLPGPPLATAPLSAPLSGAGQWGRSMLLGTGQPQHAAAASQPGGPGQWGQEEAEDRRGSQGQVPMQARQVAHYSEGSPARLQPMAAPGGCKAVPGGRGAPPRGYQPASPGQLGKGSLLYILGSSASSFRAKALAAAVAHQGWG